MSHFTDAQLDHGLNSWAMWVAGGCGIAALGYKPLLTDQTRIQDNNNHHTALIDSTMPENIERTVSVLAVRDRITSDVGRMEYGAHRKSHNPTYDKPNQRRNAAFLDISLSTYKRKLALFRTTVWCALSVNQPGSIAA